MSTAGSNLQAAALMRARLIRKRKPRRAQLGRPRAGWGWYASTNYGVAVLGATEARAASHLTDARLRVNLIAGGEPYIDWIE